MEILKTFEGYIDDKIKALKRLKVIIDFIDKYEMEYFVIGWDEDEYHFDFIEKTDNGYEIEYEDYTNRKPGKYGADSGTKNVRCDILELSTRIINALLKSCDGSQGNGSRLEIEYHLEMGQNPKTFLKMIKQNKDKIEFNSWMFGMFIENGQQKEANTFEFQDQLFSSHPEAFDAFMEEANDIRGDYEPLKLHPQIKKKYKDLFEKWDIKHQSKKYNI